MPRKRNKRKSPRLRVVAPEHDEPILEPLPSFDVPRERFTTLNLSTEPRLQAVHFADNVYDGQDYRVVPVSEAQDLSVWLADHGIHLMDVGDWIVLDVLSAVAYLLSPEIARLTVEAQFGQEDSVPLESLFSDAEN